MASIGKAVLYGFLVWLIAFAAAFVIFPLRESMRPLFESIMPVVLAVATVVFGTLYLRPVRSAHLREAVRLGGLWFAISILIDLPLMLSPSPMQMSLGEYLADIGVTYLIIPAITVGLGLAAAHEAAAATTSTSSAPGSTAS